MRVLFLTITLFLSSCGGGGGDNNQSSSTDVSISFGQSTVATGAIGTVGNIPANIQSVSVVALNAAGNVIAGPVVANRPNFTLRIRVPNGNNIRFRILAFAAQGATGVILYETISAPVNLQGKPVAVPVKMNLSIKVTANKTNTFRGGTVSLIGKVSGNSPSASSPLLWAKTGGTFVVPLDAYGAVRTWTAPNVLGSYTIAARIDPDVNPDQDPTVKDSIQVDVVNRDPYVQTFSPSLIVIVAGSAITTIPLAVIGDLDGDALQAALSPNKPSWASLITTGTNPLTITLQLNPLAATPGTYTFTVGITDGFGGNITQNINVTVASTPTTTPAPVITTIDGRVFTNNPFVVGNAVLPSVIDIYGNGSFVGQVTTFDVSDGGPPQGGFRYDFIDPPLTNGLYTLTAYATSNGIRSAVSNSISITLNNATPSITTNTTLSIADIYSVATINATHLETTDSDTLPSALAYTITIPPTQGTLSLPSTFTQTAINNEGLSYTPNAGASGIDSFAFEVTDGVTIRNGIFYISYNFGTAKTVISIANGNNVIATGATCNTVWDAYGSPYVVQDNVSINSGCSLAIQQGVIVKSTGASYITNTGITIDTGGTLDIYGSPSQPVTFTALADDSIGGDTNGDGITTTPSSGQGLDVDYRVGSFGSIAFLHSNYGDNFTVSASIPMQNVTRTNGFFGIGFAGAMNQTISNLHIEHNGQGGASALTISGTGTNPIFTGINSIDKYSSFHEAVAVSAGANPQFNNFTVDMHGGNHTALIISGASTTGLFFNNTFQNSAEGIRINSGASPIISNNIMRNNGAGAYFSQWFNPTNTKAGNVVLRNNKFVNNLTGLYIKNTTSALVENNLIRGNVNEGIRIDTLNQTIGAIQIRNNLIGENGAGIHVVGNANPATDTYATIQNNTVGGNVGTGLLLDTYTSATVNYNIFAGNGNSDVFSTSLTSTSDYNLTADGSLPTGSGLTDIYADPQFVSAFYISDGSGLNGNDTVTPSPAIDPVGLVVLASNQPFITTNPYAQPNIADSVILDLGYHHANPAPIISSVTSVATSSVIAGGFSQIDIKVLVTPKDNAGNIIGAGLDVQTPIPAQGFVSQVLDLGDGSYELTYSTFTPSPSSISLTITANGVPLPNTIVW